MTADEPSSDPDVARPFGPGATEPAAADPSSDPDVAALFAPVAIEQAVDGVLAEAADVLRQVADPVDAELWGSDLIGALASSAAGPASLAGALTGSLVPAAEAASTPGSLALLRVLAAVGSPAVRSAAGQAADRLSAHGVAGPAWAATIGAPQVGECWHYADVGGRQESLTMTFAYGSDQHAVCVLIDHGRGGKIRDAWVAKAAELRAETARAAGGDPLVVFEMLDAADAFRRLGLAVRAGECPDQPDQVDDVVAHRALLRARLDLAPHG
jgi:hypothetical protein